jgi:hypothetical protein
MHSDSMMLEVGSMLGEPRSLRVEAFLGGLQELNLDVSTEELLSAEGRLHT